MTQTHEFQDEDFNLAAELAKDRECDEIERHNAAYDLSHRYAPEGFDFYAHCDYQDEE